MTPKNEHNSRYLKDIKSEDKGELIDTGDQTLTSMSEPQMDIKKVEQNIPKFLKKRGRPPKNLTRNETLPEKEIASESVAESSSLILQDGKEIPKKRWGRKSITQKVEAEPLAEIKSSVSALAPNSISESEPTNCKTDSHDPKIYKSQNTSFKSEKCKLFINNFV